MNGTPIQDAQPFWRKRIGLSSLLLGIASGLPYDLRVATLQSWLADDAPNLSTAHIGYFSLAAWPYVLKPLWSPLLDRFTPPLLGHLGRRRGWILLFQFAVAVTLFMMSLVSPEQSPALLGFFTLGLGFFAASQDIVIDAWRTDTLPPSARGLGAAIAAWGYRLGMLIAGFLTPVIASAWGFGWQSAYQFMALLMASLSIGTLLAPRAPPQNDAPKSFRDAVTQPFYNLFTRPELPVGRILTFLALIVTYKLGDAFASSLFTVFLQRGIGFLPEEVAAFRKTLGTGAVFGGMLIAGFLMVRLRLGTALLIFGILQAVTNILFVFLADTHRDFLFFGVALVAENLATGLGSVAFVAFITALCDRRYSATQYALLASLAAVGNAISGPIAGEVYAQFGWSILFWISTIVALPSIILSFWLIKPLNKLGES